MQIILMTETIDTNNNLLLNILEIENLATLVQIENLCNLFYI
ncbi:MAG: hypothetical protein U1E31_02520 [Rickettsiales bacterium]